MNYLKLRGAIKGMGYTESEFATKLGISRTSMSQKLCGKADFTINEVKNITALLSLADEEVMAIFFASSVKGT